MNILTKLELHVKILFKDIEEVVFFKRVCTYFYVNQQTTFACSIPQNPQTVQVAMHNHILSLQGL